MTRFSFKKWIVPLAVCAFLLFPLVTFAIDLGQESVDTITRDAGYAETTENSLAEIVGDVIKTALSFVGVLFLALATYGGFTVLLAAGEEDKVTKGKTIIRQAIIGLIIVTGAYSITAFVVPRVVSKTTGDTQPVLEQAPEAPEQNDDEELIDLIEELP